MDGGGLPGPDAHRSTRSLAQLSSNVVLALRSSQVHREFTVLAAPWTPSPAWSTDARSTQRCPRPSRDPRAQPTSVLFVDLDDFKYVNDVFGHAAGDELLREVAARLAHATRPEDIVARLGGDEFAVILTSTSSSQASQVGRRVVRALEAPVVPRSGTVHVGASVGVSTKTGEGGPDELVHQADVAMYAAKAHGKGRVQVFEDGLLAADTNKLLTRDRQRASDIGSGDAAATQEPVLSLDGS